MKEAISNKTTVLRRLVLALLIAILCAGTFPVQEVHATNGPGTSKNGPGYVYIGMTRIADGFTLFDGSKGKSKASYKGFKYTKSNNTLTLNNLGDSEDYYLLVQDMGNDFKVVVKGTNTLGYIGVYSTVNDRMGLTITGSGSLTVNPGTEYGAAITTDAHGKSNTKITIDNTVRMTLYGGTNAFTGKNESAIEIRNAKSSKSSSVLKIGGKKTGNTKVKKKKVKKGYNYSYGGKKLTIKKSGKSFLSNAAAITAAKKSSTSKNTAAAGKKPIKKTVKVSLKDGASKKKKTVSVTYNDNYFFKNSKSVQGGLAKLSAVAAAAAYDKSVATSMLKQSGFKYKRYNNKVTRADNDHVSFTIGHKKVNNTEIVAILVKGTSENYEWVSNFNLGNGGDHRGFSKAEKEAWKQIKSYMKDEGISPKKAVFWVTGHSRGAAVANLLAKRLDDSYGSKNVYAYTFATPRVSTKAKEKGYTNIINYLNPGDWVTDVAPQAWGYRRYGKDITLKAGKKSSMKKYFKKWTGVDYGGFGEEGKKSLTNAFLAYTPTLTIYNSGRPCTNPAGAPSYCRPKEYCQYGLGYLLAKEARSAVVISNSVAASRECSIVTAKLVIDGKISNKFAHAHTQVTYIGWIDAMY